MSEERSASLDGKPRGRLPVLLAGAVAIGLAVYWTRGISRSSGPGWDESMNAELPSVRMVLSLAAGDVRGALDVLLGCSQYPFVYPVFLAGVQATFGIGEAICRAATTVLWCGTLFGLFLAVREVARETPETGDGGLACWLAMAFAALSPMGLAFAGTLFLEVPFACASVFALRAWMRRRTRPGPWSELAAGAWIAVCLFTKWNYGVLLAMGLAVDWLCDTIRSARAGTRSVFSGPNLALAAVPALACLWWFVLPLPASFDVAAIHRGDVLDYLGLNRELARVPWFQRLFDAAAWLSLNPRYLAIVLASALWTLVATVRPAVRTLWLVFLAMAVPALAHPFHLDRFLIPIAVPLWALAGIGLARMLPERPVLRPVLLGLIAAAAILFSHFGTRRAALFLLNLNEDSRIRDYQMEEFTRRVDLSPSRPLPTAGLPRAELDRLVDIVARETEAEERIGWIGMSPNLCPAALHLALLERGGSTARFLRDAASPMDVDYFGIDPLWSAERFAEFVSRFDVVFATEPPDLKGRTTRAWTRVYRERLVDRLGWQARTVGSLAIDRRPSEPQQVLVLACRPSR